MKFSNKIKIKFRQLSNSLALHLTFICVAVLCACRPKPIVVAPLSSELISEEQVLNRVSSEQRYSQSILNNYKSSTLNFERALIKLDRHAQSDDFSWSVAGVTFKLKRLPELRFPALQVGSLLVELDPDQQTNFNKLVLIRISPDAQNVVVGFERDDGSRSFYLRNFGGAQANEINFGNLLVHDLHWLNDSQHLIFTARDSLSANKLGILGKLNQKHTPKFLLEERGIPLRIDLQTTHNSSAVIAYEHRLDFVKVLSYTFANNRLNSEVIAKTNSSNNILVDYSKDRFLILSEQQLSKRSELKTSRPSQLITATQANSSVRQLATFKDLALHVESYAASERVVITAADDRRPRIFAAQDFGFSAEEPVHFVLLPAKDNQDKPELLVESLCQPRQRFALELGLNHDKAIQLAADRTATRIVDCQSYILNFKGSERDGVPISLALKNSSKAIKGVIIEAYGAYGNGLVPQYSSERQALIDQGFVIALVHVRGGDEFGSSWHNAAIQSAHTLSAKDLSTAIKELQIRFKLPMALWVRSAGGLLGVAGLYDSGTSLAAVLLEAPLLERSSICYSENLAALSERLEWQELCNLSQDPAPWIAPAKLKATQVLLNLGLKDYLTPVRSTLSWVSKIRKASTLPVIIQLSNDGSHYGEADLNDQRRTLAQNLAFLSGAILSDRK